jgi:hypothetical protein
MPKFDDISELKEAIDEGSVEPSWLSAVDNVGELYIHDQDGTLLFHGEYFNSSACDDICYLLGIENLTQE